MPWPTDEGWDEAVAENRRRPDISVTVEARPCDSPATLTVEGLRAVRHHFVGFAPDAVWYQEGDPPIPLRTPEMRVEYLVNQPPVHDPTREGEERTEYYGYIEPGQPQDQVEVRWDRSLEPMEDLRRIREMLSQRGIDPNRQYARERAKELLYAHLTSKQREDLETRGYFCVEARSGRTYAITDKGRVVGLTGILARQGYCIQPLVHMPMADELLAKKLLIEGNEREFLRIANEI